MAFSPDAPHAPDRLQHDEMERWYLTVFENTGTAMAIVEQDLTLHSFNSEFVRLTGIPAEELRRRRVFSELVDHFLTSYGDEGRRRYPLPGTVMEALMHHPWPGNVRELQNVLHRYVTLGRLGLEKNDVGPALRRTAAATGDEAGPTLSMALGRFEKDYLLDQLQQHRWHVGRTAASLGIDRRTLQRKMKRFGLY
jgi:transcriptional regulator of acetoin/glycerol metabolism